MVGDNRGSRWGGLWRSAADPRGSEGAGFPDGRMGRDLAPQPGGEGPSHVPRVREGAASLTCRAPLRLPVALPKVALHVRGGPRCCA